MKHGGCLIERDQMGALNVLGPPTQDLHW